MTPCYEWANKCPIYHPFTKPVCGVTAPTQVGIDLCKIETCASENTGQFGDKFEVRAQIPSTIVNINTV